MDKLTSFLYKAARLSNDVSKVARDDPEKIANRVKNKVVGRKIASKLFTSIF